MKKIHKVKLKNTELELEFPDRDHMVYIVGADTYLGAHFAKHWLAHGYEVYGCGQAKSVKGVPLTGYSVSDYRKWDVPDKKYSWLMLCHDPHAGYEEHSDAVRSLCEYLKIQKRSVRICYPSSAAICASSKQAIRETSEIVPHNRLEMAIATAENWLKTCCYESNGGILPFVFRLGEVYGDELGFTGKPGLVNHYLNDALKQKILQIPGLGSCYRSLSHIGDICKASIKIMETDIPPRCVNIPGERYSIIDIVVAIAEKYQTETCMGSGSEFGDDYSRYGGNRNLSAARFKKIVDFVPDYSFRSWLAASAPVLQQH